MTIHQLDILEQILSRLPAKSIGQFRCVSKAWKYLLSQPRFIKTHLNRIKQHPIQEQSLILVCDRFLYSAKLESAHQVFDEMITPTMLDFVSFEGLYSVKLASCDGLIVVGDVHRMFTLINPTTREIKPLPVPSYVLDHRYCNTLPGIGYDSFNDDYKVVTISYYIDCYRRKEFPDDDDMDDMLVNVYSVKNGTWKTVDDSPFDHEAVHAGGVYCNGHIHWIAKRDSEESEHSTVIVAFDFEEEKFRQVPHPSSVDGVNFSHGHLFVVEGCLCLSPYWMDECFVMKDYGVKDSWTKITILDHDRLGFKPLCLLGEEQMVLLIDEPGPYEKLVLYNVKQRTSKEIKIQRFPDDLAVKETFVKSLLSPHFVYRDEAANEE